MATVDLTEETMESTIKNNNLVVIDWWASWCGPCIRFAPIFEDISDRRDDFIFAKVNTEQSPQLAGSAGISAIPTLMIFKEGVLIYRESGAMNGEQFNDLLDKAAELDMVEVHAKIAAEKDKK